MHPGNFSVRVSDCQKYLENSLLGESVKEKEKVNIKPTLTNFFYHTSTAREPEPVCDQQC